MEKYSDYYDDEETEERVQISQATCYNEDEIADAIERSKRQLKKSKVPYGYTKLDEQIITTVYKIPENQIIHRSCQDNIEEINENIINDNYISNNNYENSKIYSKYNTGKNKYKYEKYETAPERDERYDYYQEERIKSNEYNNKIPYKKSVYSEDYYERKGSPRNYNSEEYENINNYYSKGNYNKNENYDDENERYEKYKKIKGSKIENYFENNMSKDGEYLVSMTLSKKTQEKKAPIFGKEKYRNNFQKKVIEINENEDGETNYDEKIRPVRVAGLNYKRKNKNYAHEMEFPYYQKEEIYDDNF